MITTAASERERDRKKLIGAQISSKHAATLFMYDFLVIWVNSLIMCNCIFGGAAIAFGIKIVPYYVGTWTQIFMHSNDLYEYLWNN